MKLKKLQRECTKLLCFMLNKPFILYLVQGKGHATSKGDRDPIPITKKKAEFHSQSVLLTIVSKFPRVQNFRREPALELLLSLKQ